MKIVEVTDKKKFYSKLFLYKTFLYRNVEFNTNINDEELKEIIKAINIKKNSNRIVYIYDYCCSYIDEFYKGKNLCEFKDSVCISHQSANCKYKNGCCRMCLYQSEKGCQTSNLTCKLFYCSKVKEKWETKSYKDLRMLNLLTWRQRLIVKDNFFASREEYIEELKTGLITLYAIKTVIRLIKMLIKYFKNVKK